MSAVIAPMASLACPLWCALLAAQPDIAGELARLEGHEVEVAADGRGYRIVSVAGEGAPLVGVVERHGRGLYLAAESGACLRLLGPLARPRIAGPRYKVWVLGEVSGDRVRARRLGVLAPPPARARAARCGPRATESPGRRSRPAR